MLVEFFFDNFVEFSFPALCSGMVQAADELGQEQEPPYSKGLFFVQIRNRFVEQNFVNRLLFSDMSEPIFTQLVRNDFLYADANYSKYSTRRIDDSYRTFSENILHRWPGYVLARSGQIVPKTDHVVHLDDLLGLLRSKDIARYEAMRDHFFGPTSRYTTGTSREQMSVAYATYPRSGNSLMRKYFENMTGTATGSDMVLKHNPNVALQFCGFKAEGITDRRVFINKTHFPYVLPFQWNWQADIAVVCTRYALDVDPSFFYMIFTGTHTTGFKNSLLSPQIRTEWRHFQHQSALAYKLWFDYWLTMARTTDKPVYFFRFEDILANPEYELRELFKFILGMEDLTGTVAERRIQDVMAMGSKKNQVYKPRSGGSNKNLKNYEADMIEFTKSHNEDIFHIFGYVKDENPANPTPFLDYEGKAKPENVARTNEFRKLNERAVAKRRAIKHGDLAADANKITVGPSDPLGIKLITHLQVMEKIPILDNMEFAD